MEKSKVYWSDFRTEYQKDGRAVKLKKLALKAGINTIDMKDKFVAIKMHFGEKGNLGFLRPNYARAIVDIVKELGGKPFLTDCNTMYPGSRKNALEHLECAWENGFTPLTVGCPIIIADGLKGLDEEVVPVKGGVHIKEARIGKALMDADVVISLTHFKGHEMTGFGGTIKNIGMGGGSRAGKCAQHCNGKVSVDPNMCKGCKACLKECANNGLKFDDKIKKMTVTNNCVGCGRCIGTCNFDAIGFENWNAEKDLCEKMTEYCKAVVDGRPCFHLSLILDVAPNCDCHFENDVSIIPDVGMFASFDPVALDKCCGDMCAKTKPYDTNTWLTDKIHEDGAVDHHDPFKNCHSNTDWQSQIDHGVKIGLGNSEYELIKV